MHDLVLATFAALEDADLSELVDDLRNRVLARNADEVLDTTMTDSGVWQWSFKPMVELMLRHVRDIAAKRAMSTHERRLEIAATIEFAGF